MTKREQLIEWLKGLDDDAAIFCFATMSGDRVTWREIADGPTDHQDLAEAFTWLLDKRRTNLYLKNYEEDKVTIQ